MKRFFSAAFFFPLFWVLSGCGAFVPSSGLRAEETEIFTAAVWNVQALFDGRETGSEYGEYRESSGWTAEKYTARLTALSRAVPLMIQPDKAEGKGPGLIGLVEIENEGILKDLASGPLSKQGYRFTCFTKLPGSSLGIGFLSRFPFKEVKAHSVTTGGETAPRPILEARIEPGSKPLVFLLCHWKSKLGGEVTEAQRRSSAFLVQRRLRDLRKTEPETPVIVMGDLNENHDEFYRRGGKAATALLPDDPAAALAAGEANDYLVLSGKKPPAAVSFPDGVQALYSHWEAGMTGGSYFFRDDWETIDHVLLSEGLFDGSGWEYTETMVLNRPPFINENERPNAYMSRSGRGLSDHLPLLLHLRYVLP